MIYLESVTSSRSRSEKLQATVIPLLLEGMAWIIKERPEDPVENLAMFLIKNNPMTPELHRSLHLSEFE
jgi:protein dpy-30